MAKRSSTTGDLLERIRAEIDERISLLLPHVEEHRQLLAAAASLELDGESAAKAKRSTAFKSVTEPKKQAPAKARRASTARKRATAKASRGKPGTPQNATQQAIEAALEHGSHTLSELVLVTAIEAAPIRAQLSRLQRSGVVSKVRREGKAAYSLLSAATAASLGPKKGASVK